MHLIFPTMKQSKATRPGSRKQKDNATSRGEFTGIMYPGKNDVMLGRGGESNFHSGNLKFREFAHAYREQYKKASKGNKPKIAAEVVAAWRSLDPPGRFLARNIPSSQDSLWYDVGESMAIKRAIKTLGEKTQRERRAEKRLKGSGRGSPTDRVSLAPANAASGVLVPSSSERDDHSSVSSSVVSDASDKKMQARDNSTMIGLALNHVLGDRLSSPPRHQYADAVRRTEVAAQSMITDPTRPATAAREDFMAIDVQDPLLSEDVWAPDPRTLPTAAQLAETVFDDQEPGQNHEPIISWQRGQEGGGGDKGTPI